MPGEQLLVDGAQGIRQRAPSLPARAGHVGKFEAGKQFRVIATRCDKTARNLLAAIYLAASVEGARKLPPPHLFPTAPRRHDRANARGSMATTVSEFPMPLDQDAMGIVRRAARVGGRHRDVTFTGLLISLLLWYAPRERPLRDYLAEAGVNVDAILQSVGIKPGDMHEFASLQSANESDDETAVSETFSPSATTVLQYAADLA